MEYQEAGIGRKFELLETASTAPAISRRSARVSVVRGRMIGMRIGSTRKDLRAEIDACGYFPELVEDAMMIALADEELLDFVVHHEPTFNRDEIHRHVTVLALTPHPAGDRPYRRPACRASGIGNLRGILHGVCGAEQDQHGRRDSRRYPTRGVPGRLGGCLRDLAIGGLGSSSPNRPGVRDMH